MRLLLVRHPIFDASSLCLKTFYRSSKMQILPLHHKKSTFSKLNKFVLVRQKKKTIIFFQSELHRIISCCFLFIFLIYEIYIKSSISNYSIKRCKGRLKWAVIRIIKNFYDKNEELRGHSMFIQLIFIRVQHTTNAFPFMFVWLFIFTSREYEYEYY